MVWYWVVLPYMKFEVGERLNPEIRGGGTAFPCILLDFNPWLPLNSKYIMLNFPTLCHNW